MAVTFPTAEEEMAMPLDVICSRAKGSTRREDYEGCLVLSTWTFPLVLQRSPHVLIKKLIKKYFQCTVGQTMNGELTGPEHQGILCFLSDLS